MTENDERMVNRIVTHEIRHLHASLNNQMENMVKTKAIDAAMRLKVLRKMMLVEATLIVEIAKIEANVR